MLKIIELFAGIGSQTQALKNLGIEHKPMAISEIDKFAIKSYTALHGPPNNLGDIRGINDLPEADLWTYSFPCQDISTAGRLAGIRDGTRSGLLWEVERLLTQTQAPKFLLMENVKNLISKRFRADYEKWLAFLSALGYTNYWQILNSKNYGIPQNRERVFCVSILGRHKPYRFPEKQELKLRLRDMLEAEVDEKYFLKESTIQSILVSSFNSRRESKNDLDGIVNCLCRRDYKEPQCVQLGKLTGGKWDKVYDMNRRVFDPSGISPTIHCAGGGNTEAKIAENFGELQTHQTSPMNNVSAAHTEEMSMGGVQTSTGIEQKYIARRYEEFMDRAGYIPEFFNVYDALEIKDVSPTITAQCCIPSGSSTVLKAETLHIKNASRAGFDTASEDDYINLTYPHSNTKRGRVGHGLAQTLCTSDGQGVVTSDLRIRKLTPRECLRLMGWNDEQIDKIQAAGVSSTQQYRQAGNGIVIQVLEAIFRNLF